MVNRMYFEVKGRLKENKRNFKRVLWKMARIVVLSIVVGGGKNMSNILDFDMNYPE